MFLGLELRLNPLVSSKYDICYRLPHLIYCLEDNFALIINVITFNSQLNKTTFFYVLLTVHLSIILVNDQLNAQFLVL